MNWDFWKPFILGQVRHYLTTAAGALVTYGLMKSDQSGAFVEIGSGIIVGALGLAWSWWDKSGRARVQGLLKKLTGTHTVEDAKAVATVTPPAPIASPTVVETAKAIAGMLLLAILLLPAVASAQAPKPRPALTGNPVEDIKNAVGGGAAAVEKNAQDRLMQILAKPFNDLADFITSDAEAAMALATAIPELQDGHGQQCWKAMGVFTKVVKAHPIPVTLHAATDLQAIRLAAMAANNLCQDPHCTQVFADLANGVQKAAPVNFGIPIPSLNSLCALVPQVSVVAPIAVPPAAPPANP